jgi:phosphate:Na+ symporter
MVILAQQDLVSLENAVAVVMGANIGTTVTALLAGTVATKSGQRTAFSHLIFKCVGIGICLLLLPFFIELLKHISSNVAQQIALSHFLLNLVIVAAFIFLLTPFAVMMNKLLPGDDDTISIWPEYLNENDLHNPRMALDNVHKELKRQMSLVHRVYQQSIKRIFDHETPDGKSLFYIEMVVKNIRKQTVSYLWKISAQNLSQVFSKQIFAFTAMTNDIDRLGAHALCISKLSSHKSLREIKFSTCGENELKEIIGLVSSNFEDAVSMIEEPSIQKNMGIISREEQIDEKVKESRDNHLERFHKRLCDPEAGPIFVEMLLHLERMSDLCNNVAEYMSDIKDN